MKRIRPIALLAALLPWLSAGCGSPTSEDLLGEATQRYQEQDLVGAIELAKQAKDIAEDEITKGWASMVLGNFYSMNRESEAARDQFEEVLENYGVENPNPVLSKQARDACRNLIAGWMQESKPQKALDQALATSTTLSRNTDFSLDLSMSVIEVYTALEKYDEALDEARRLIALTADPRMMDGVNAQIVFVLRAQGKYDQAADVFLGFAEKYTDPQMWGDALFRASKIYPSVEEDPEKGPDYDQARTDLVNRAMAEFNSTIEGITDPDRHSELLMRKSTAAWDLGQKVLAIDCLTSITTRLAVNPQIRGWAYVGLADFDLFDENYQEALDAYTKAIEEFGQFPEIQEYVQRGIFQASQELAQRAVLGDDGDSGDEAQAPDPDAVSETPASETPAESTSTGAPSAKLDGAASPEADAVAPADPAATTAAQPRS